MDLGLYEGHTISCNKFKSKLLWLKVITKINNRILSRNSDVVSERDTVEPRDNSQSLIIELVPDSIFKHRRWMTDEHTVTLLKKWRDRLQRCRHFIFIMEGKDGGPDNTSRSN